MLVYPILGLLICVYVYIYVCDILILSHSSQWFTVFCLIIELFKNKSLNIVTQYLTDKNVLVENNSIPSMVPEIGPLVTRVLQTNNKVHSVL